MMQVAVSSNARQMCSKDHAVQMSEAALDALQILKGAGFNTTGLVPILNQAAQAINKQPAAATPMLALLANSTVLDTNRPWIVNNLAAISAADAAASCSTLTPRALPEKAASAWYEGCSFPAGGITAVTLGADVWCPAASGPVEYTA
jgi:hypothetical protein